MKRDDTFLPLAGGLTADGADGPACRIDALGASDSTEGRWAVLSEVTVGLDPEGVVVDPVTNYAYVSCSRSNAVFVVDLARLDEPTVVGTIPVGNEPIDIAIDEPTRRFFTADARNDQLSVVDLASWKVIKAIPVGSYPAGIGIDSEHRRLYCGDTMGSSLSVIDLDSLERIGSVEAELGAGAVAVDVKRQRAYCVNFITASVTVVDLRTLQPVDRIVVGEGPCAAAVNGVRDEIYIVNSLASTVARIDLASGKVLDELPVPNAPVGIAAAPSGDRFYVGNRGDGSMSIIGLDGMEWARVPVGAAPGGVAVHPEDPGILLVANAGSSSVTIVEDRLAGPPASRLASVQHPLVGQKLPGFELYDLQTGRVRNQSDWAEKKYILNFFASW